MVPSCESGVRRTFAQLRANCPKTTLTFRSAAGALPATLSTRASRTGCALPAPRSISAQESLETETETGIFPTFSCRIKTRIQTEVSDAKQASASAAQVPPQLQRPGAPSRLPARKHTTARQMLLRILKEGGPLAFYRGYGANMLNTFSTGL